MNDLDRALHDTLAWAADDDVHVEHLLAGAQTTGRRYRRRRRVVAACAGLTAGAVALAVTMTVLPGGDGGSSAPAASAVPSASAVSSAPATAAWPQPPVAPGATTAAASADVVGRPQLLHLSLAQPPFPIRSVQFQQLSDPGQENLYIEGDDRRLSVRLGTTTRDFEPLDTATRPVDVGGRPGVFATGYAERGPSGVLRWQSANGLWLQIHGARDVADALALAALVRLDRTFRCVVPYRFGSPPAGMTAVSCSMAIGTRSGRWTTSLGVSNDAFHAVVFTGADGMAAPTGQLDGRPVSEREEPGDGGDRTFQLSVDRGDGVFVDTTVTGRYDKQAVRSLMSGLVWAGGNDPATWPTDPLAR